MNKMTAYSNIKDAYFEIKLRNEYENFNVMYDFTCYIHVTAEKPKTKSKYDIMIKATRKPASFDILSHLISTMSGIEDKTVFSIHLGNSFITQKLIF